jgi:hypothetical protein
MPSNIFFVNVKRNNIIQDNMFCDDQNFDNETYEIMCG